MAEHVIEQLAALDYMEWKKISAEMAWMYRRGTAGKFPASAKPYITKALTSDEWLRLKAKVNTERQRRRRAAEQRAQQKVKRSHQVKALRRKEYMRAYMQRYRSSAGS